MLVPATTYTGMRFPSSHLITPTCAKPSAPPPSSTRPIRGRWLPDAAATALAGGWATPPGVSCAQRLDGSITITQTAKLQSFIAPPKRHECLRCHVSLQKEWGEGFAKNSRYYCDTFPLVAKVFTVDSTSEPFPAISRCHSQFGILR